MPAPVSVCQIHGYYAHEPGVQDSDACPECGVVGDRVLSGGRRRQLSTFLSGSLRHFPDDVGVTLDATGWTAWSDLVAAVDARYDWAAEREVQAVVATDPKGRFETRERDGREIRAAYGHSVDVDLNLDLDADADADRPQDGTAAASDDVPETLYHGTARRNLDAIVSEGLRPMGRQAVHLSADHETARAVGRRHADGDPVVLAVDVTGLRDAGFDVRKRGVATYTVARVPPEFLGDHPNV